MDGAMLSKSLIQLSVDGQVCVPSLLFDLRSLVELMKIIKTSFKRSHACIAALSASNSAAGHRRLTPLPEILDTHGHVWVSFLWGHCSFLLGPSAHKVLFVPSKSLFPVLCKFWWFYGRVNGDLLQEGLCHSQVYCTQSPCLCMI